MALRPRRAAVPAILVLAVLAAELTARGAAAAAEEGEADETCAVGDVSASCLGGDAAGQKYHWPMQKGDANRTGRSPHVVPRDLAKPPSWRWEDPDLGVIRATPLIDDELNIYLATINGRILKFSPDGKILWSYRSRRGQQPTVPALMDGALYQIAETGELFALDMRTGEERWASKVGNGTGADTACIFAASGVVVAAARASPTDAQNKAVVALNTDGSQRWRFELQRGFEVYNFQGASPGDGTLIFQDSSGGLYRVSLATGELIWESGIQEREPPVVALPPKWFTTAAAVIGPNGLVYAVSNWGVHGMVHAYKLSTGEPVWRKNVTLNAMQGVAIGKLAGSEGLSVVFGVGPNPGFPSLGKIWYHFFFAPPFLFNVVACLSCCCCCWRRRRRGKSNLSTCCCLIPLTLLVWLCAIAVSLAGHGLSLATGGKPHWLFMVEELPQKIIALDAATGAERWVLDMHPLDRPACAGDEELFLSRLIRGGDALCLPDSWAQGVVDADGTAFLGFADGRLLAVRDENGDGRIDDQEISEYDFGHGFQGSQGLAPGVLAVAPCGGGLWVWKSEP